MTDSAVPKTRLFRFGPFELDVRAGELRKHGIRIKLREQPVQILLMLLEHPGEVVLREEIRLRLWPNNTIVEFDHGINAAIQKLRDALGESADSPRYVETVARRGYRLLGEVERVGAPQPGIQPAPAPTDADDLTGKVLSHYRIVAKLGEGGMGVVYRAEDLKLGRQVALKFLPCAAGELPQSILGRFEREARAASALNHPHICTIHGLENLGGQPAIVMELVEGETLAARLAKGPLPLDEALALAVQISDALADAHRRGVVHRDLKPANIMLTGPRGRSGVKVLDFGLAKMERAAPASAEGETATQEGAIIGTLHYMSPEQVESKEADTRSDIFSFGVVLYEMITGKRAFEGESAASVMAGILERQPPPLESNVPPALNRLLSLCMAKDPGERWQSARDLKAALEWVTEAAPQLRPRRRFGATGLAAVLLAVVATITLIVHLRERPPQQRVVRLQIPPPGNEQIAGNDPPVVSPDGTRIVFSTGFENEGRLFVRSLDSLVSQGLPGTEGGWRLFWSPDGRSVGFAAGGKLKTTNLPDGPPVALCNIASPPGGAWNRDDVIIFAPTESAPLMRIAATGGTPVPVTKLDAAKGETSHGWPSFLPDGRHFLFTVYASESANGGVYIGSLDSPRVIRLLPEQTNAQYTEPGYVVFSRGGSLMAQPFDPQRLQFTGEPASVVEEVSEGRFLSPTKFSASAGVLAYRAGSRQGTSRIRWFDRKGSHLGDIGPAGDYFDPALSPDGHAVAVGMKTAFQWDLWVLDLVRGTNSRLTFDRGAYYNPSWSPDGRQIAFCSDGESSRIVRRVPANGAGKVELAAQLDRSANLSQWTADGQYLIMTAFGFGKPYEIWAAPLSGGRKPFPVVTGPLDNDQGRLSSDGKWIAYAGAETGRQEIYVQDFPPKEDKWQISTAGGSIPRWRADGRELFYRENSKVMSVEVQTNAGKLEAGVPKPLFDVPGSDRYFDVSADGQRFPLVVPNEEVGPQQSITVVLNWPAGIKR